MAKRRKLPERKRCTACGKMFDTTDAEKETLYYRSTRYVVWRCPLCDEWNGWNLSSLKQYAWMLFAKTVKLSECHNGKCRCVTCFRTLSVDSPDLHAGHFLGGRSKGILFDRRGVHCQCKRCNVALGGNSDVYWQYMLDEYDRNVCDELVWQKNDGGTWTDDELRKVIHECEDMLIDFAARGLFL